MSCYQELTEDLRQAGLRMTPQRLMVMDVVFHHDGHITAEDIHTKVKARYPYVDLSTIYRTLELLKDEDCVTELRVPDGPTQFEAALDGSHHHAICQSCGAMLELDPKTLDPLRDALFAQHGFRADLSHIALFGICADCAGQTAEGS